MHGSLSLQMKRFTVKASAWSAALHGSELWTLQKFNG